MNINALKTLLDNGEPFANDAAALAWVTTEITVATDVNTMGDQQA